MYASLSAGPQTKLRTDRKLPVLYYISYGYVFPHTNHHSKKLARAVGEILFSKFSSGTVGQPAFNGFSFEYYLQGGYAKIYLKCTILNKKYMHRAHVPCVCAKAGGMSQL
jgi:hypothetical protein